MCGPQPWPTFIPWRRRSRVEAPPVAFSPCRIGGKRRILLVSQDLGRGETAGGSPPHRIGAADSAGPLLVTMLTAPHRIISTLSTRVLKVNSIFQEGVKTGTVRALVGDCRGKDGGENSVRVNIPGRTAPLGRKLRAQYSEPEWIGGSPQQTAAQTGKQCSAAKPRAFRSAIRGVYEVAGADACVTVLAEAHLSVMAFP